MMLTTQQQAAVEAFASGASIAISSVAGSGKTHTLTTALATTDDTMPGLCLAFNKRVAVELDGKLPDNIAAKTFNSVGHLAWMQNIRRVPIVDDKKVWNLWRELPAKERANFTFDQARDIVALVSAAKVYGLMPDYPPLRGAKDDDWLAVAEAKDIIGAEHLLPICRQLLLQNCKLGFAGTIDYDDQLYLPCVFSSAFPKYAVVGVDEAQDLSSLQHRIVEKSLAMGGRLVIAGDRNQSIYSWRGAHSNSFEELTAKFALHTMPLTKSFRCPRAVVREAQRYVPEMEAAGDIEGNCFHVTTGVKPRTATAFLSRTNAPLMAFAFSALRQGIPINYLGRDFLSGLKSLYKLCPTEDKLADWLANTLAAAKSDSARMRARDRATTLGVIIRQGGNIDQTINLLTASPKADAMTLATIHKAKGLEWPNVVYMDYSKVWRGDQEQNVKYVGVTRAKETLTLDVEQRS